MKENYTELLKDPRWNKRRLEILKRDNYCCVWCGSGDGILHVHHLYYDKTLDPWEYGNDSLVTLCESCHEDEEKNKFIVNNSVTNALRSRGFENDTMGLLSESIKSERAESNSYEWVTIISFALKHSKLIKELFWAIEIQPGADLDNRCFECCSEKPVITKNNDEDVEIPY